MLIMLASATGYAQPIKRISATGYSVAQGLLHGHVVDIAEQENGMIWVSTGVGLQRFNGTGFETFDASTDLPSVTNVRFLALHDGKLIMTSAGFISVYNEFTGKFRLIYKFHEEAKKLNASPSQPTQILMPVGQDGSLIWFWNIYKQEFFAIDKNTYTISERIPVAEENIPMLYPYARFCLSQHKIFSYAQWGIGAFDLVSKSFRKVFVNDECYQYQFSIYDQRLLLVIKDDNLCGVDIASGEVAWRMAMPIGCRNIMNISFEQVQDSSYVVSINNNVYMINAATGKLLYKIVNKEGGTFSDPGYISRCMADKFRNLWIVTIAEGLKKINLRNVSIKYYGTGSSSMNFNRCIYADKSDNVVITGTLMEGIFVYDTSANFIRHFSLKPGEQTSNIIKTGPSKYIVFTSNSGYVLDPHRRSLSSFVTILPAAKRHGSFMMYQTAVKQLTDSSYVLYSYPNFLKLAITRNKKIITDSIPVGYYFSSALLDHQGRIWLANAGQYVIYADMKDNAPKFFSLGENIEPNCLFEDKDSFVWLGTQKGLFKINSNGNIIHRYMQSDGLADACIYSIVNDREGNLWFSTNIGISCLYTNGNIRNLYEWDGLQAGEFNMNSSFKAQDGELFFGGIKGVNSFHPSEIPSVNDAHDVLLTNITVMGNQLATDSAYEYLHKIELPYNKNSVRFEFTSLGWYNPEVYNYWYKIEGIDRDWISSGHTGAARYTLEPGTYTFLYTSAASLRYGEEKIKRITIVVHAPFWLSWWFRLLTAIVIIACVAGSIYWYNQQRYNKQLRKLKLQEEISAERQRISRDLHDHLGIYATILRANAEKLQEPDLPERVRNNAAKISETAYQILDSLNDTIWMLNNEQITATDLFDRLKIFTRIVLSSFSGIAIKFHEKITDDIVISPEEALNLKRILQEGLQNIVKHAKASEINITMESGDRLCLTIQDNGVGFQESKIKHGNGIFNMQHRAAMMGYELSINSIENGTTITIKSKSK